MPAPSLHQVRDAIKELLLLHPNTGKKKLCQLLNVETGWEMVAKLFRTHLMALDRNNPVPTSEKIYASIKALRLENPAMGNKKFASVLNARKGWSLSTKEVRERLAEVDSDL